MILPRTHWVAQATVKRLVYSPGLGDYEDVKALPPFAIDGEVCLSAPEATAFARDLLNPFGDEDITVDIEVTQVVPDIEAHYARALDEVYHLRRLCADEAQVRQTDMEYKTYPKSRREIGEGRISRLRQAACGRWGQAISGRPSFVLDSAMRRLGQATTLTRHQFEQEAR